MRRSPLLRRAGARVRPALSAPLPLLGLLVAAGPLALSAGSTGPGPRHPAELAYHELPALPAGSTDAGAAGVGASAIALAVSLEGVPMDALGTECPADELAVRWTAPADGEFTIGAHTTPIGPAPTEATTAVNGVVVCGDLTYAYMGFEARYVDGRWDVVDTPFVGEGDEEVLVVQPAPEIPAGPKPVPVLAAPGTVTGPIEGYAAYEPQRTCDPTAKVGTKSLAGALLRDYAGSRNLGIVRGCSLGGRSEHKEGRAFDWGVNITNANEKAAAEAFIGALMATDAEGNKQALARRMGVMYVIWDRQIWSSYRASEGWRPYTGSSPHRDHVHISLSWAGATGRTSFWSGTVPPDLPTASPNTSTVAARRSSSGSGRTGSTETARSTSGRRAWGGDRHDDHGSSRGTRLSRDQLAAGVAALWHGDQPPTAAEIQAWLVGQGVSEGWAQQYAQWAADRAARRAERDRADDGGDERPAEGRGDRDDDGDDDERSDWEARREEWEREREAREERQAEEAAERQRRREEREAAEQAERDRRREERERREAEEEAEREARQERGDGDRRGRGGRRGGGSPTTTAPPATTTTAAPATTTTAAPAPTTTAAPPPDPTTTTTP